MFLMRCIFWLGLVFTAMPWGAGAPPAGNGAPVAAAQAPQPRAPQNPTAEPHRQTIAAAWRAAREGGQMAKSAAAQIEDICIRNPRECLAAARRLQSLFGDLSDLAAPAHGADTLSASDRMIANAR